MSSETLFWDRVDTTGVCWEWTGSTNNHGYGSYYLYPSSRVAHRHAYELLVGEIPAGLEADHLCRNRRCVNPDHVDLVTHAKNIERRPRIQIHQGRAMTHCKRGHPLEGDNLYSHKGRRHCRTCRRAAKRV